MILKNEHEFEPLNSGLGDTIKMTSLRTEDSLSKDQMLIIENKWKKRTDEVFDADVIFLNPNEAGHYIATAGSYKIYHALPELYAARKETDQIPYLLGSHAIIRTLEGHFILFRKHNGMTVITGGATDTDDIIDDSVDVKNAAIRETIEETGLTAKMISVQRTGIWFDKVKPHVFYTYVMDVDAHLNDDIFEKTALLQEGIESYQYIPVSDFAKVQQPMARSAMAALLSVSVA